MNKPPKTPKTSEEVAEMMRTGRKIDAAVRRAVRAVTKGKVQRLVHDGSLPARTDAATEENNMSGPVAWKDFAKAVNATLNNHGHTFQHQVTLALRQDTALAQAGWQVACAEFPVTFKAHETKADIVLLNRSLRVMCVVETKRTAPGTTRWVFFPSRAISQSEAACVLHFERLERSMCQRDGIVTSPVRLVRPPMPHVAHLAIQVWSKHSDASTHANRAQGEPHRSVDAQRGTKPIEEACKQVLVAASGMTGLWADERRILWGADFPDWLVFPIVLTNTELCFCEKDLTAPSEQLGQSDVRDSDLSIVPETILQYSASQGLIRMPVMQHTPDDLSAFKEITTTRSIFFANPTTIAMSLQRIDFAFIRNRANTLPNSNQLGGPMR